VKCTDYFVAIRDRPDRAAISDDWIRQAIQSPLKQAVHTDGRMGLC
jgi:hypothetical protein